MKKLKFAVLGCGFWSKFQIGAWSEIDGVELVALYNRTQSKAEAIALQFGSPRVYNCAETLLQNERLDFVEIITDVDTHAHFTEMAVKYGIKNIICQKPMAPDFATAQRMVVLCRDAGVNLFIHENYRWQAPIRRFKAILDSGIIGKPFKARVSFLSGFPVFDNQPFLAQLDKFILTDMGSHIYDVVRYLFGEAEQLICFTRSVNQGIKGEDVAVALLEMKNKMPVYTEMSYASHVEHDSFSTVHLLVEGSEGSLSLGSGFEIKTTTRNGTQSEKVTFPSYPWADPDYIVNHESGIPLCQNILAEMNGLNRAENSAADNVETVKLVWASYYSAKTGLPIRMADYNGE